MNSIRLVLADDHTHPRRTSSVSLELAVAY